MNHPTPFRSNETPEFPQIVDRRTFVRGGILWSIAASLGLGSRQNAAQSAPVNPRLFTFVAGTTGAWTVTTLKTVIGDPLPKTEKLDIINGSVSKLPDGAKWVLRGVTSNERYVTRDEKVQLVAKQAPLGRVEATHSALIPIRKNAKWWGLSQEERRAILEDRSNHLKIGLKYLPSIARRLHHCRDLGDREPFDFITLFDYAKADSTAFEDLVAELRATEEWKFVDREIDIRLIRA